MQKAVKITLLSVSIVLIGIGLLFGGYRDTFNKAVKICLECIGIG